VNDASALKRADVGIVVAGATDAARAAADMVLTQEDLSSIILAFNPGEYVDIYNPPDTADWSCCFSLPVIYLMDYGTFLHEFNYLPLFFAITV